MTPSLRLAEILRRAFVKTRVRLAEDLQGVVFAQHYLMLEYDCPKSLLDKAIEITPGMDSSSRK